MKAVKIILALIFPIVFNAIFWLFACGTELTNTTWLCYAFIHVAYIVSYLPIVFSTKKDQSLALLNYTLGGIASIYFFVELVVGLAFILFWNSEAYFRTAIVVQFILLALAVAVLLVNILGNDTTRRTIGKNSNQNNQFTNN